MKLKPYQHKYTHTQCTNSKRCVSYINTTNTHGHSIFIIQHNFKPFWIFGAKTEIIDRLYWITHKSSPSSKLRVCTPRNWGRKHVNWFTQVWGLWKPSNAVTCSCSDLMNLNCFEIWGCLRRRKTLTLTLILNWSNFYGSLCFSVLDVYFITGVLFVPSPRFRQQTLHSTSFMPWSFLFSLSLSFALWILFFFSKIRGWKEKKIKK